MLFTDKSECKVYVPNTSNAFFASGFQMADANQGELENYLGKHDITDADGKEVRELYERGGSLDRTNYVLKQLKSVKPQVTNFNKKVLNDISDKAENKVSYVYKKQFCGLYTEMQRTGKIKRDDSWEKFVNPNKIGLDNHLQKAYNTSMQG